MDEGNVQQSAGRDVEVLDDGSSPPQFNENVPPQSQPSRTPPPHPGQSRITGVK